MAIFKCGEEILPCSKLHDEQKKDLFLYINSNFSVPSVYNTGRPPIYPVSEIFLKVLFHIAFIQSTQCPSYCPKVTLSVMFLILEVLSLGSETSLLECLLNFTLIWAPESRSSCETRISLPQP